MTRRTSRTRTQSAELGVGIGSDILNGLSVVAQATSKIPGMEEVGMVLSGASALVNISEDAVKVSKHQMTWGQFGAGVAINAGQIAGNLIGLNDGGNLRSDLKMTTSKLTAAEKKLAKTPYRSFIFRSNQYEGEGVSYHDLETLRTTRYGDLERDDRLLHIFGGTAKTPAGKLRNVTTIQKNFKELVVYESEDLKKPVEDLEQEQFELQNKLLKLKYSVAAGNATAGVLNNAVPGIRPFETGISTQKSNKLGTESTSAPTASSTPTSTTPSTIASPGVTANPAEIASLTG